MTITSIIRAVMEKFVNLKLRTKFLLAFAIIILVTVLTISVVTYTVSVGAIKRNTENFSTYLIEQIGLNLVKRTTDIEQIAFQQFRNSNLSQQINTSGSEPDFFKDKYIKDFITELLFQNNYFLSVLIIDADGKEYTLERYEKQQYNRKLLNLVNKESIQAKRGRAMWFHGDNGVVYMAKALYDIPTSKYSGIVIVAIDSSYISSIVTKVDQLTGGNIFILNEENELLLQEQTMNEPANYFMNNKLYDKRIEADAGHAFKLNGSNYIYSVISMSDDKWKVVQILAVGELTRGTEVIKFWTVNAVLLSLLVAVVMAVFISKNITSNVRILLQSMSNFSVEVAHRPIVPKSRDEVGVLAEKFNSMADKIHELFDSVIREKLLKQKAEYRTLQFEYKALQAQINPHFLYNTLESIHSMAKIRGEDEIGEMIYLLGKLLRDSIKKKGDVIFLHEEIDFIRNYLTIHEIIYGDKIQIRYELDDSLMMCKVPKFILQPLVENSIKYGIEEKPGVGRVGIACRAFEGDLLLEVSDNGVGMDEDTITRVLEPDRSVLADGHSPVTDYGEGHTGSRKDKHTSVGMISVHKRVRILYGERYGLEVISEPGLGTTIRVKLPIIQEGDSDEI